MLVLHGIDGLRRTPHGAIVTIGNFDGLHLGHRSILNTCRRLAAQSYSEGLTHIVGGFKQEPSPQPSPGIPGEGGRGPTAGQNHPVVVVTFEPHPLTVLRPKSVAPRLTPAPLKQELIESLGVDVYVVLPPEPEVLNLTAEDFWTLLRDDVRPAAVVEGADFTFGKDRGGTVEKLMEWTARSSVKFELVEPVTIPILDMKLVRVSSTLIRWLLGNGRVREAAICLGRPYTLRGTVVQGFQRGRTIGIPTANLDCEGKASPGERQMIPADGIYAGRCRLGSNSYLAAVSIGNMPTFGDGPRQIEAHLLDFDGDLYGQTLDLELLDWLRDQSKFSSIQSLKAQIDHDVLETRRRKGMDPAVPIARGEMSEDEERVKVRT